MFIVRAAILFSNGELLEGYNYSSINRLAHKIGATGDKILGFVNSSGDFVNPVEAVAIALESKQISEPIDELSPDDLWPEYKVIE